MTAAAPGAPALVDLESGSFAVAEKSPEFTLVSWHSVFDRQIGKSGTGIMSADAISWQFGRERARLEISYHSTRCGGRLEP